MKRVVVASKNAVKRAAAEEAFKRMFPSEAFSFEMLPAASGVCDQPMTDAETYQGAKNRVEAIARDAPDADYWVAFEGGAEDSKHGLAVFAWVVVRGRDGREGKGRAATFYVPEAVAALMRGGMELGQADDQVFGRENSKESNGAVGILTGDAITRTSYYAEAAVLALIPFKNPERY